MGRQKVLEISVVAIIVLAGCAETGIQPDTETWMTQTHTETMQLTTVSPTETTRTTDSSLFTRDELYGTVIDDAPDSYNESLFYVSENGTWYRAYSNKTIGDTTPSGNNVPFYSDKSVDLTSGQRPAYVWKVTRTDGCPALAVYDASSGQELVKEVQPQCPPIPTNRTFN